MTTTERNKAKRAKRFKQAAEKESSWTLSEEETKVTQDTMEEMPFGMVVDEEDGNQVDDTWAFPNSFMSQRQEDTSVTENQDTKMNEAYSNDDTNAWIRDCEMQIEA